MKDCGSCAFFTKVKNFHSKTDRSRIHSGGLCELHDRLANSDSGKRCPDWKGIKYNRKIDK